MADDEGTLYVNPCCLSSASLRSSRSTSQPPRGRLMRCPQCGHENAAEMKFCGECGTRLTVLCRQCHRHRTSVVWREWVRDGAALLQERARDSREGACT